MVKKLCSEIAPFLPPGFPLPAPPTFPPALAHIESLFIAVYRVNLVVMRLFLIKVGTQVEYSQTEVIRWKYLQKTAKDKKAPALIIIIIRRRRILVADTLLQSTNIEKQFHSYVLVTLVSSGPDAST